MKKGFTLMEILAVLLILAVVTVMVAPAFRAVRYQIKNSQAQAATKKLAEAVRSYYQFSRGHKIKNVKDNTDNGCFNGPGVTSFSSTTCQTWGATGIPASKEPATAAATNSDIAQLFACGFLSYKDFVNVPYRFCVGRDANYGNTPNSLVAGPTLYNTDGILATATGNSGSGDNYQCNTTSCKGYIYVDGRMKALVTYDDEEE